jgi:hypothetical protein
MTTKDTAIIGAGPYGLSIAAHLRPGRDLAEALRVKLSGQPLREMSAVTQET